MKIGSKESKISILYDHADLRLLTRYDGTVLNEKQVDLGSLR
jgi:hypothetical protein